MRVSRRSLLGAVGLALGTSGVAVASRMRGGDSLSASDVELSESAATDIATGEVDGAVREVELEREDGTPVYEVEIAAGDGATSEVAVHADDGTVLEVESEDDEDDEDETPVEPTEVSLSETEAREIATGELDGTVREVELEREDGTPVYQVGVETGDGTVSEVTVHANGGSVLEVESEDDDEVESEDDDEGDDGY